MGCVCVHDCVIGIAYKLYMHVFILQCACVCTVLTVHTYTYVCMYTCDLFSKFIVDEVCVSNIP